MIIQGGDLMLYVTVGGQAKSIAYAINHTLSIGSNSSEVSTKDDAQGLWTESTVQKLNWSCTTENMYTEVGKGNMIADLFEIMTSRTAVDLILAPKGQLPGSDVPAGGWTPAATGKYTGKGYITDLQINAANGDNASYTATFTGTGALVYS